MSYMALQGRRKRDLALAWRDLASAANRWHLIVHVAWLDVRQRYRRSVLGPLWLTVSIAIQIGAMGLIYSELFHQDAGRYLPHLAVRLTVWGLISGIVTDSCFCFIAAESWLKQEALPKSMFPVRMVLRNFLIFAHNLVILVAVVLIFQTGTGASMLLAIPGLLLIAMNGVWLGLVVGLLCTRFRDLPPIIASFMQVVFFVTPVIWMPQTLPGRWWWLVTFNPFANLLSITSNPLLGAPIPPWSWPLAVLVTAIGWVVAFLVFGRFRARITYWL